MSGNMIALGALLLWPIVALGLYMTMSAGRATIWTILAGYLLLPPVVSFDFQGVPSLDKTSIPNLCALILAPLMARGGEFRWPKSVTVNLLLLIFIFSPFATAITNADTIRIGTVTLAPLGMKEGFSAFAGAVLQAVPFVLGAALLGTERGHRDVLFALVLGGVAYSLPILAEIRLSPFMLRSYYNVVVEGYFLQQLRGGGFRAMVFLGHGLLISTFVAMALLCAIGLTRRREKLFGVPMVAVACWLGLVLLLNKSVGAAVFAVTIGLGLVFLSNRRFLILSFGVAIVLLIYPVARTAGIIPYEAVTNSLATFSPDRAGSLAFRLKNEDLLLNRASERPLFGWGGFGRNRVFVVTSYGYTSDLTITDGAWIITLGVFGWTGYLATFGLLTYPFWRAVRLRNSSLSVATVTLLAAHLLNLIDLIPNSSLRPITWLVGGALAGMTVARRSAGVPARVNRSAPSQVAAREVSLQS